MRRKIEKFAQYAGGVMLIMTAGLEAESITPLVLWLAVTIGLLYYGKVFSFQQK